MVRTFGGADSGREGSVQSVLACYVVYGLTCVDQSVGRLQWWQRARHYLELQILVHSM